MSHFLHDPRVMVVASAISERQLADSMEDHFTGSIELAEVAVRVLDRWLMEQAAKSRSAGLPMPRLGGMKFCDCTLLINEIMRPGPQTERPDRDN